jgi:hypothetical protein
MVSMDLFWSKYITSILQNGWYQWYHVEIAASLKNWIQNSNAQSQWTKASNKLTREWNKVKQPLKTWLNTIKVIKIKRNKVEFLSGYKLVKNLKLKWNRIEQNQGKWRLFVGHRQVLDDSKLKITLWSKIRILIFETSIMVPTMT